MSERQHIYEDLNESSSARPGGSQQLGVLPSPNSKRTPKTFLPIFWLDAGILDFTLEFPPEETSFTEPAELER